MAWHIFAQPMLYNDSRYKQRRQKLRNSATESEQRLWFALRKRNLGGYKFQRQYGVGPFIVDFYCPSRRLVVEVDGGQHFEPIQRAYDNERTKFLNSHGICVVRVTNAEVMNDIDSVLEKILEVADTPLE
jgi:very-short-patch-repair endonuclease